MCRIKTYHATTDKQDRDRDVLHILSSPSTSPAAKVLKEDVGRAIEEDEEALNKLGRRSPLLRPLLGANVPCPAKLAEAARPTTQGEDAQPEEDAALDPMREAVEDVFSFLLMVC